MQSLLGEDADRMAAVVAAFDKVRKLFAFKRVEVPILESTAVFARSLGETTDVVSKEMYSFEDRGGDSLTLRPEFTAGLCRAYLTEGWQQHAPLKAAIHGPVFRYERPQKGRFRQFHQLDAEIIGAAEPAADVELLAFADQLLRELGIADGVTLQLNTLGDAATRDAWRAALIAHFAAHRGDLSEDSLVRLDKNPMRILDSKDPRDRPIADAAPGIDAYLSAEAGTFFERVTRGLEASGVAWTRNDRLVRGLDYYRHTAFEFVTDRLGAQGTVLAGGRYDGLIEALGGPHTPAVGWAAGMERLGMLIEAPMEQKLQAFVIAEKKEDMPDVLAVTATLRRYGLSCGFALSGNAKRQFETARKAGTSVRLVLNRLDPNLLTIRFRFDEVSSAEETNIRATIFNALHTDFFVTDNGNLSPESANALVRPKGWNP
ncbi:MAG TPA: histidine--tRNA ligase [Sphingomonas sp.]|nr:histidine--tRNA ligase [Sphingomonas sp.]